jgi:DNA-binding NarL/FixJ family response regulator
VTGLLLSDDLIFTSRILATARAHGLAMAAAKTQEALLANARASPPAGVILDLHNPSLDLPALLSEVKSLGAIRVVAYGSHVDAERLKAARASGCDLVLPRSAFVDRLESDLPVWLSR